MVNSLSGLLVVFLLIEVGALKLTDLLVPKYAGRGASAELVCTFDTERAKLYSVKWYKDENEFYRFMPDSKPHSQVFPLDGVSLDESISGMNHVVLKNLQFSSSGSYRCEVSTEAPTFETVYLTHNITVLANPTWEPRIDGFQETYAIDDVVTCNCTTAPSKPAPTLQWYINNEKANLFLVDNYKTNNHSDGTYSASSTLRFSAERQHFLGAVGLLTLGCEADAPPLEPVMSSVTARLRGAFTNQKLAQDDFRKSGSASATFSLPTLLIALSVLLT